MFQTRSFISNRDGSFDTDTEPRLTFLKQTGLKHFVGSRLNFSPITLLVMFEASWSQRDTEGEVLDLTLLEKLSKMTTLESGLKFDTTSVV